jgi:hypothetical protein
VRRGKRGAVVPFFQNVVHFKFRHAEIGPPHPHQHRLQHPMLHDGILQFKQRLLVELLSWLLRIGMDVGEVQVVKLPFFIGDHLHGRLRGTDGVIEDYGWWPTAPVLTGAQFFRASG